MTLHDNDYDLYKIRSLLLTHFSFLVDLLVDLISFDTKPYINGLSYIIYYLSYNCCNLITSFSITWNRFELFIKDQIKDFFLTKKKWL